MENLFYYCQGESHKSTGKPCQDFAYSETSDALSMAIVCDGHGGERYFRSHHGSKIAKEVIIECVKSFVEKLPDSIQCQNSENKNLFGGMPFTQYSQAEPTVLDGNKQARNIHDALKTLFSSIISQWNSRITEHANNNPLDTWEEEHVEQKYREEFINNRMSEDGTFEKTYGCTLMVYVQTAEYWFAFHLGDGKFLRFQVRDGKAEFDQPIPWDEKCFLNKTTSICDSQAIDEFRYCYQGDGTFPQAVFLGSDGMDDSYGDGENLTNFYIELYKIIAKSGKEKAQKELEKYLPIISLRGSKDDMSVVCIYNEKDVIQNAISSIEYQIEQVSQRYDEIKSKVNTLKDEINAFEQKGTLNQSEQIDLRYKTKDLEKAEVQKTKLISKKGNLTKELNKLKSQNNSDVSNNIDSNLGEITDNKQDK